MIKSSHLPSVEEPPYLWNPKAPTDESIQLERNLALVPGPELSIIVPTFNERENVIELVKRLDLCLRRCSWEIIFVDDDSPDGTSSVARELAQRDCRVRCVQRIGRRGLSSACIEGMLASSAPYLAVMDADLQHDEKLLPRMWEMLKCGEEDIVVGSRYVGGGGVGAWDKSRADMSRQATWFSRLILRADLKDPMSGFFMLRREAFAQSVRNLSAIGFKILLDILASSPRSLCVKELPYEFRPRQAGESKLDTRAKWDYGLLLIDKLIGHYVPVRFIAFMLVGSVGVVVHFTILTILFKGIDLSFVLSQGAAALVAMTANFAFNNAFTYRDVKLRGWRWLKGWVIFVLACGIGIVANVGISNYLFESHTGWTLAALAGILVGAVWNYATTMVYIWGKPAK